MVGVLDVAGTSTALRPASSTSAWSPRRPHARSDTRSEHRRPRAHRRCATARPMPLSPPVMTAFLSCQSSRPFVAVLAVVGHRLHLAVSPGIGCFAWGMAAPDRLEVIASPGVRNSIAGRLRQLPSWRRRSAASALKRQLCRRAALPCGPPDDPCGAPRRSARLLAAADHPCSTVAQARRSASSSLARRAFLAFGDVIGFAFLLSVYFDLSPRGIGNS